MKLTKKEIYKISKLYNLRKVKKIKLIKEGMINNNFIFQTKKEKFIVRFLRKNPDKKYLEHRKVEFRVLNFLAENNFPYQIPTPLKNKNGLYLSQLSRHYFTIYKYLEGRIRAKKKKLIIEEIKEFAKALAIYHKTIEKLEIKKAKKNKKKIEWLAKEYKEMAKVKPKNKLDKLMLINIENFKIALNKIKNIKFKGTMVLTHSDFQKNNILFNNGKLTGILDFDNVDLNFKAKDIAITIKSVCNKNDSIDKTKLKVFLSEYRKHNKLTKEEEKQIFPLLIRNYCIIFWWGYKGKMKDEKRRYETVKYVSQRMKKLLDEIK